MTAITELIRARSRDAAGLRTLAIQLSRKVTAPELPTDPVAVWESESLDPAGTWQEVRAAVDHGDLSEAEYEFLSAAVDALTEEDR